MKRRIDLFFVLVLLVILQGCMTVENGNQVVDVDKTCAMIKVGINIGLPIAIEKRERDEMVLHAKEVMIVLADILQFLDDKKGNATLESVDKVLERLDSKLSQAERHALRSSLELSFLLLKEAVDPKQLIGEKTYNILRCFLDEVREVFNTYTNPDLVKLGAKPLKCEEACKVGEGSN
jgi:hypothetical protein